MIPSRVFVALCLLVWAAGPAPGQRPAPKPLPTLVLLLDTFRLVEGPAERVGDVYRVRVGRDVRDIPAGQVLYAGESRADVQRFLADRAAKRTPAADRPPVNSAADPLFAAKVQPILMNLCARCHCDSASAGGMVLKRVPLGYADPDATRRNARAVASYVWSDDPAASPLLLKAVTPHGDLRDPPLLSRAHPAFRNLEVWVHLAAATDGSPTPDAIPGPAAKQGGVSGAHPQAAPTPARGAAADDPFSPDVFNRLAGGTR